MLRYFGRGRYLGIGFEYVAAVTVLGFLGHWCVDRNWDISPWGMLGGAALGMISETYRLIRESQPALKPREGRAKPPAEQ